MKDTKNVLSIYWVSIITFLCFIGFTVLNIVYPIAGFKALLFLVPGAISILALRLHGYSFKECFLSIKPISKLGLILLLIPCLGMAFILGYQHQFALNWVTIIAIAPLSAIAQEVFFRSALLLVLLRLTNHRVFLAVFLQALFFCAWHLKEFMAHPHLMYIAVTLPMLLVLGFLWGLQVARDRTILYTVIIHALFLVPLRLATG